MIVKEFNNTNFKRLRQFLGLNQTQFADKINSSQQIIAMIENNKRGVPSSIRESFYNAYNISIEEAQQCDTADELVNTLNRKSVNNQSKLNSDNNVIPIPFYTAKAAAGSGITLPDYPEKDVLYFDKRWLKNIIGINPGNASIITARGDSMDSGQNKSGDIRDGDLLMVDNSIIEIINNRIFVLQINNELLVKRVVKELDGTVSLVSANPIYPDRIIQECDAGCIIGKVVWNGSKENI